ncbi:MAG TPA: erythromycin esterase family protein [Actinomycetota bacterium]|nr:erythromycin esterase family protein [Actinomycetota bacterium]
MARLPCEKRLTIVPGASHLFEEPGALETVAELAADWFHAHLGGLVATTPGPETAHTKLQVASSDRRFRNRRDAGRALAALLDHYVDRPETIVMGLPRGGVPVAYEVATHLGVPLDVFLVRKLGIPGHEELAMGAIASGGVLVLNDDVVRQLNVPTGVIRQVADRESLELARREKAYRDGKPMHEIAGKNVILVDDGLATGASMQAAVEAVRRLEPDRIIVAVPTAPGSTCEELADRVDEVMCASSPSPFLGVGNSYLDFSQTSDAEVRDLLRAASSSYSPTRSAPATHDIDMIRSSILPVDEGVPDDSTLLDLVGDAHFVLIGEASHGTHEFYAARAAMTRTLIEKKGFCAVAVEADWPDALRVSRYVHARGNDLDAEEALRGFERFPTWMWRNVDVVDFIGWLREHNDRLHGKEEMKVGFYGLDLYSLHTSMQEVVSYLDRVDPAAAIRARSRYACFDHVGLEDGQAYGYSTAFGAGPTCEREVIEQLVDLNRHAWEYARRNGMVAEDDLFYAEQNARSVKNAERYYRTMFGNRVSSWNLRDTHMAETLDSLAAHLGRRRAQDPKIVVWAHNSHIGDARATELGTQGEINIGQLVRQAHPNDSVSIGFTTHGGTVTAASDWGGPAERKHVRPALAGSIEELFHRVGEKGFLVPMRPRGIEAFASPRLERAIGVIYRPETERQSHYFNVRLEDQFDAVIHIDETRSVEPLERTAEWDTGEAPETFPFGV